MSPNPVSVGGRADATELKSELLGRLGLRADASDQDIEGAHNALVEFLELAPHEVRSWAASMTTDVDEAFALLFGPEQELVLAAQLPSRVQDELERTPWPPAPAPAGPGTLPSSRPPRNRWLLAILTVLAIVAVGFVVFKMGKGSEVPGISGKPTGQETTAAAGANKATPVDQAKVGVLMKKISANPKDIVALQSLGDLYFAATDYKTAAGWEQKILDVDPKNQVALLALGAAQFNVGNAAEAKKHWLVAAGLYPNAAEVHYDLGFLYMSQTPPDKVRMTAEWKKVVDIDPSSDLAKTVSSHLKASTPTASPTPSAK